VTGELQRSRARFVANKAFQKRMVAVISIIGTIVCEAAFHLDFISLNAPHPVHVMANVVGSKIMAQVLVTGCDAGGCRIRRSSRTTPSASSCE
jgi:hypothetical protein